MRSLLVIVTSSLLALVGCGDVVEEKKSCTSVYCSSQVNASLAVSGTATGLVGSKLVVCRNGTCEEGTLERGSGPDPFCKFRGQDASFPSRGPGCRLKDGGSQVVLDFVYALSEGEAKDGDTYAFRVLDKTTSEPTAKKEGAVTYTVSQPNGPGCDPTCSHTTLN